MARPSSPLDRGRVVEGGHYVKRKIPPVKKREGTIKRELEVECGEQRQIECENRASSCLFTNQ